MLTYSNYFASKITDQKFSVGITRKPRVDSSECVEQLSRYYCGNKRAIRAPLFVKTCDFLPRDRIVARRGSVHSPL